MIKATVAAALPHAGAQCSARGLLGRVVEEIGLRILNGSYIPREALPIEPELMEELRISRTVLREAIKILSAKGLVESRPKTGTRVRPREQWNLLDPTVLHLYCQVVEYSTFAASFQQVRVVIEPEAAALAAAHRTRPQLNALEEAYEAMEAAKEITGWTAADLRFHEAILDATGNPFMRPLGALISTALETLLAHSFKSSPNPFESLEAHRRVLETIRNKDVDRARASMRDLLAGTALSISRTIRMQRRSRHWQTRTKRRRW
jgi:DNA-binding FadR family transcriptional regulator